MKGNEIFGSGKYLKASCLEQKDGTFGTLTLTIKGKPETKEFDDGKSQRVISFREDERKLGLNKTNWNMIARISGKDDDDEWDGVRVVLWVDENVQFGGDIVPAIRIRRPSANDNPPTTAQSAPVAGALDKTTTWIKYRELGGTADGFKADVEKVEKETGTTRDKFTHKEWATVLEGCIPF